MVERGEDLSLVAKATQNVFSIQTAFHQLDSNLLVKLFVLASSQVDHAHAAATDLANDFVGPYYLPGRFRFILRQKFCRVRRDWLLQKVRDTGFVFEERFDF